MGRLHLYFVTVSLLGAGMLYPVSGFTPSRVSAPSIVLRQTRTTPLGKLSVSNTRDADLIEMMVGGERYEMIPLPDSLVDTTLFVGNLCEFVTDDHLSDLFQCVSKLQSIPACVIRKPNMMSLQYGFVTFPTIQEKEAALVRFHNTEWRGRRLKVEEIKDDPKAGRVRVPERMVAYTCGARKKTRDGRVNSLRRIQRSDDDDTQKKKRRTSPNKTRRRTVLSEEEGRELDRASRKGYVTLDSTGYRRGRKGSALANRHRQWCDDHHQPQIIHCKASGGRPLDHVLVDLSPLRLVGENDPYKDDILVAATKAGMELRDDYVEDNTLVLGETVDDDSSVKTEYVVTVDEKAWATQPIWRLPVVSMGVFEGERSKAKAMARELALLWGIPEEPPPETLEGSSGRASHRATGAKRRVKARTNKGLRQHRRNRRQRDVW